MKNRWLEKLLDFMIVVCSATSIVFLSGVIENVVNISAFSSLFVILTLICCVYYLCNLVYIWKRKKGVFFSLGKYVCVTGISFCTIFAYLFMQPFYRNASENVQKAYLCMHMILPICVILEYSISDKGHFNKRFIQTYMFLFLLYGGIVLLCGQYAHMQYPYAFLDHEQLGYKLVIEECCLLTVWMYIHGKIILVIDRMFRKKRR